jgi:hypothetical protein
MIRTEEKYLNRLFVFSHSLHYFKVEAKSPFFGARGLVVCSADPLSLLLEKEEDEKKRIERD